MILILETNSGLWMVKISSPSFAGASSATAGFTSSLAAGATEAGVSFFTSSFATTGAGAGFSTTSGFSIFLQRLLASVLLSPQEPVRVQDSVPALVQAWALVWALVWVRASAPV
jgi:hypothetical protein